MVGAGTLFAQVRRVRGSGLRAASGAKPPDETEYEKQSSIFVASFVASVVDVSICPTASFDKARDKARDKVSQGSAASGAEPPDGTER